MSIDAFNFVAFVDNNKNEAAHLAEQCGFHKQNTDAPLSIYTAGQAIWLIHPARNTIEAALLKARGPAPYLIGMADTEAKPFDAKAIGLHLADPNTLTLHPYLHIAKTSPFIHDAQNPAPINYKGIDHCAIACEHGTVNQQVQNLIAHLNMHETYRLNVADGDSGMQSVALANHNGQIRLPMIGPDGDTSQVRVFLNQAQGMGIQHVGLATDNIIKTVRHLKQNGMRFLKIKPSYYASDDFQKIRLSDKDKAACQELSILVDQNEHGGYLLQIFSEPCLGPMMIEIIERHHHDTFGAKNIKSLFDTVADYQHTHTV